MSLLTDLSTGLLTFAQFGHRDTNDIKVFLFHFMGSSTYTCIPCATIACFYLNCITFPSLVPFIQAQAVLATAEDEHVQSEGADSDHFTGSNSSFLVNEKLMSVDSMNSNMTGMTLSSIS